ncbi:MAG: hypothetical protein LBP23_02445, partial [Treponema sp.]|nr:hypothetical protein [Treponema sp.]
RLQKFGIKPDGIINFLSNEPPFKQKRSLRYRRACPAEAHPAPLRLAAKIGKLRSLSQKLKFWKSLFM